MTASDLFRQITGANPGPVMTPELMANDAAMTAGTRAFQQALADGMPRSEANIIANLERAHVREQFAALGGEG